MRPGRDARRQPRWPRSPAELHRAAVAGPAVGGGHGRRRRDGAAHGLGGPGGAGCAGVGKGVGGREAGRPAEGEAAMTVPLRCVADDGPGRGEGPDPGDGLPHHRLRPQRAGRGEHGRARGASAPPALAGPSWAAILGKGSGDRRRFPPRRAPT